MWEIISIAGCRKDILSEYMQLGYEPFAVSIDPRVNIEMVWLKKETLTEEERKLRFNYYVRGLNEICLQQPEPIKRASRRTAKKSKG